MARAVRTATDFQAEVDWGLQWEVAILKRWVDAAPLAATARGFIKSGPTDPFDFVVFDEDGTVLCYLEVKRRRTAFAKFGDAIFPRSKRTFALLVKQRQRIPVIGVTEYGCGTLVEVSLAKKPAKEGDIQRRDRTHLPPVPHVFYSKAQLTVLEEGDE